MTDCSRLSAASIAVVLGGFSGELTCGVSGEGMNGGTELIYGGHGSCNFLAFVLIIFIIFSVFPVVAPRWQHSPGRSLDPVCKIRTGSHRSGYKRATLARRVTNEERTKCCHKLVRRGALDAGRSRCSDRLVQIAIRGRNLMLTLNFLLNQPRTGQWPKVSNKRRRELLLKINITGFSNLL